MTTIEANLQQVRTRLEGACTKAGRDVKSVTLLAVSKTFDLSAVRQAQAAGQRAFGENYVQEGLEKIRALRDSGALLSAEWHCIGPLQSNKSRPVAEHFDWVQSVDRLKIAQRLSEQRPAGMAPLQLCIQVNVDGGASKSGVVPAELPALAEAVRQLPNVCLRGLMSVPDPVEGFEAQREVFLRVKRLFDELNAGGHALDTLSLGMSEDLEAAVAAGSTMVRVGRAIFGHRALRPVAGADGSL
jgi:pyridoxal phosphate enzyme (YggS family)